MPRWSNLSKVKENRGQNKINLYKLIKKGGNPVYGLSLGLNYPLLQRW